MTDNTLYLRKIIERNIYRTTHFWCSRFMSSAQTFTKIFVQPWVIVSTNYRTVAVQCMLQSMIVIRLTLVKRQLSALCCTAPFRLQVWTWSNISYIFKRQLLDPFYKMNKYKLMNSCHYSQFPRIFK